MLLEAIITKADLDRFAAQFLPTDFALEDGARLTLHEPAEITLVPERGVRLGCQAKVHWPVMGLQVPLDVHSLVALLRISIGRGEDGATLDLALRIEKVDFAILPAMIDERIRTRINEALVERHVAFSWNFQDTLSRVLALPPMIQSNGAVALEVQRGIVKITEDALAFAVSFTTGVRARSSRSSKAAPQGTPNGGRVPRASASARYTANGSTPRPDSGLASARSAATDGISMQSVVATGGAVAGLALAAAFGLGRLSKRQVRRGALR
jgi:hypothetical protein